MENIRNFCIIAHIDHGKSTLADRLLEKTGTVSESEMQNQVLDDMDLERERGITIKSHAIQMQYKKDQTTYTLNLIDTPGHVDFSYEVSRSIAACEGALLIVDATQGVQSQTISNLYLAMEHNLTIIPVLNKIDLPGAMIEEIKDQIVDLIACDHEDIICASAKEGIGIDEILDAIVKRIPAPKGDPNAPLKAIIFDSVYNPFKGIEVYFRIFDGTVKAGDKVQFVNTKKSYEINELGILKLKAQTCDCLSAGNVGYIVSGIKKATEVKVGDTITHIDRPCLDIIKGFENVKPMVFAGVYPVDTNDYEELKEDLEKLQLNDASLVYTYESSVALGIGFRCGFLGMLHMEIVQERLEREFGISVITTAPSVHFKIFLQNGEMQIINTPAHFPDP
jgi:GTP-binding protein LepA